MLQPPNSMDIIPEYNGNRFLFDIADSIHLK